jgi:hypothetical protein
MPLMIFWTRRVTKEVELAMAASRKPGFDLIPLLSRSPGHPGNGQIGRGASGLPLARSRPALTLVIQIDFLPRETDRYFVFVFAKAYQEAPVGPIPVALAILFGKGTARPIEYQNIIIGPEDYGILGKVFFSGAIDILAGNGLQGQQYRRYSHQ